MCTTPEPEFERERNSDDRPAATGPDELHVDGDAFGLAADGAAATSFPRGTESAMEPVMADFPDRAGVMGAAGVATVGAGVVMGAAVTAAGAPLNN